MKIGRLEFVEHKQLYVWLLRAEIGDCKFSFFPHQQGRSQAPRREIEHALKLLMVMAEAAQENNVECAVGQYLFQYIETNRVQISSWGIRR